LSDWDYLIEHDRFDIVKFLVEEMDFEITNTWCDNFDGNWSCHNDYCVNEADTIFEIPIIGSAYKKRRYDIIEYVLNLDTKLKRTLSYDTLILRVTNFNLFKILVSCWDDIDANCLLNNWYYHSNSGSISKINYILDNFNIITVNKVELMLCQLFAVDKLVSDGKKITNNMFDIVYRVLKDVDDPMPFNKGKNPLINKEHTLLYYKTYYFEKNGSLDGFEKHVDRLRF